MRPMRWRSAIAAIGLSVLAVGSLVTGAQAADDLRVTFHATPGACVDGVSNSTLSALDLVDHGTPVEAAELPIIVDGSTGKFQACFPTAEVAPGLTLIAARSDLQTVSFTIPALSLHVDRVTDVIKGLSRTNHALTVRVYDCSVVTGKTCPRALTRTVTTNGSGHFTTDVTHTFDIRGLDMVNVTFTTAAGHTYQVWQTAPYFDAFAGTSFMVGQVNPHQHATFRLKSGPGGTTLSTRSVTGTPNGGHYSFTFASSLRTGRQVSADFASDARVTLPSTATTIAIVSHDQVISTRCLPDRKLVVYWQGPHAIAVRTADSHGRATVNLSHAEHTGFRLAHLGQVTVVCQTAAGDIVERTVDVP